MTATIRLTAKLKAAKEQEGREVASAALANAGITGTIQKVLVFKNNSGTGVIVSVTIADPSGEYAEHLAASTEAKAKGVSLSWGVTDGPFLSVPLMYPWTGPNHLLGRPKAVTA